MGQDAKKEKKTVVSLATLMLLLAAISEREGRPSTARIEKAGAQKIFLFRFGRWMMLVAVVIVAVEVAVMMRLLLPWHKSYQKMTTD